MMGMPLLSVIVMTTELVLKTWQTKNRRLDLVHFPFSCLKISHRQAGSVNKDSRFDCASNVWLDCSSYVPALTLIALHTSFNSPLPAIKEE